MKLSAVLILCSLALCGARGADFFGTKEPVTSAPTGQAHALPTNEIELRKFLIGTRWTIDGQPNNTYDFLENGTYKSPKFAVGYTVTGPRRICITWSPQLKIDCEFNESFTEFKELGGDHNVLRYVQPAQPAAAASIPGSPASIQFLNIPWNATPAEAKRAMTMPAGASVKEESPDHIVLTGGTFETFAVERWEIQFVNGKFTKGIVQLVRRDERNEKGWINDQISAAIMIALEKKYGKSVGHPESEHNEDVWEVKDSPEITRKVKFYRGWRSDPRFDITYSYKQSPSPATPTVAAPAQPTTTTATLGDIVKTYRNSLVFVTGADGSGSGFVARLNEANFLFTNDHVAAGIKGAGFKSLDGTKVTGGAAASAVGHDIFRMQLGPGGTPFEVMLKVDENAAIDDEVVVLGNSEGAGVINTIKGRIVGIGPNLVEVDAPFQPGNSGSPIVHLKTGKVIGVATYLTIKKYDAATKEVLKAPVIRRFGYRLDSVKTWQPVAWPAFYAQAAEIQAIETLTGDLDKFLIDISKNNRVTPGVNTNPAIKTRIDQWLADKRKRLNPKDAATVDQNFLSFLKVACRSDIMAAKPRLTYDYFQRQLGEQEQGRGEIAEIFDKIIKDIQKDR